MKDRKSTARVNEPKAGASRSRWPVVLLALALALVASGGLAQTSNGDEHDDLMVTRGTGINQFCAGDGVGGFTCTNVSADSRNTTSAALGDVDDDGNLDVVFSNFSSPGRNQVCVGDGTGSFTCQDINTDSFQSQEATELVDLNGDTFLDVVFGNFQQRSRVCLGDGAGAFTCSDLLASNTGTFGIAVLDINADGDMDVFESNLQGVNQLCLGDGSGTFTCSTADGGSRRSVASGSGDFNMDGDLDVFIVNNGQPSQSCLGDGTGALTCTDLTGDPNNTQDVELADVNGDTFLDVVLASGGGDDGVCFGDGLGGFTCGLLDAACPQTGAAPIFDVNGDGDLDVFMACFSNGPHRICTGDGAGNFNCANTTTIGPGLTTNMAVAAGDPPPVLEVTISENIPAAEAETVDVPVDLVTAGESVGPSCFRSTSTRRVSPSIPPMRTRPTAFRTPSPSRCRPASQRPPPWTWATRTERLT